MATDADHRVTGWATLDAVAPAAGVAYAEGFRRLSFG